jgi:RNA polymerase sigma-70 factor (ECF subfamily)
MSSSTDDLWSKAALAQNRRSLLRYLLVATGDIAAAEDLVQEVLRIGYEKRHRFSPGTDLGAWLRAIARNCLKKHFAASRKTPVLGGDMHEVLDRVAHEREADLLDDGWHKRRLRALRECIEQLRDKARQVIECRYRRGMRSREVGDLLHMTVQAVNVTVFRTRSVLADCVRRKVEA